MKRPVLTKHRPQEFGKWKEQTPEVCLEMSYSEVTGNPEGRALGKGVRGLWTENHFLYLRYVFL